LPAAWPLPAEVPAALLPDCPAAPLMPPELSVPPDPACPKPSSVPSLQPRLAAKPSGARPSERSERRRSATRARANRCDTADSVGKTAQRRRAREVLLLARLGRVAAGDDSARRRLPCDGALAKFTARAFEDNNPHAVGKRAPICTDRRFLGSASRPRVSNKSSRSLMSRLKLTRHAGIVRVVRDAIESVSRPTHASADSPRRVLWSIGLVAMLSATDDPVRVERVVARGIRGTRTLRRHAKHRSKRTALGGTGRMRGNPGAGASAAGGGGGGRWCGSLGPRSWARRRR
jgi:hypothetical protein